MKVTVIEVAFSQHEYWLVKREGFEEVPRSI